MAHARGTRRAPALMAAAVLANLGAAGVLWHAATMPIDTSPRTGDASVIAPAPPPSPPRVRDVPELASLGETLARPLFQGTRRPPQPRVETPPTEVKPLETEAAPADEPPPAVAQAEASAASPPPPLPEGLRLVGVAGSGRTPTRALLRLGDSARGVWYAEGEILQGWRVAQIGPGEVWLEASGHRQQLTVRTSTSAQ